ncbi:MAG: GNAT family N-acetyltransferase [Pseudomonadales bacterium]|jgi:ribosomal protein S18 acetylase RimI-like enzyme
MNNAIAFSRMQFSRAHLPELLALITANAQARWPEVTYMMNSDIVWRLPGSNPKENLRLWYDQKGLAGYAWFDPNSPISMDIRVDLNWAAMALDILSWLEQRRALFPPLIPWLISLNTMEDWEQALDEGKPGQTGNNSSLQISALDKDQHRIEFLEANGYEATGHFHYSMTRGLDVPIPEVDLPDGMQIRHVLAADFPKRVATHRDAWYKSSFDMDDYLRVRNLEIFDPELDLVAATDEGEFGSYCIGWTDTDLGIGSFEPVGTRPAFRRMGLGRQVNYEGLRRMKAKGMHSATIGTAGFNNRAFGLYSSCGFELIDKVRTYMKKL